LSLLIGLELNLRGAGGNTATGLPLGSTLGSLLSATNGSLSDRNGSILTFASLLSGANASTPLSSLGLGLLNLNVSALLQDPSCPGGGILNPSLNVGNICVGAQVITSDNIAKVCVQQSGGCCCSPGESLYLALALALDGQAQKELPSAAKPRGFSFLYSNSGGIRVWRSGALAITSWSLK
jgi:hypothetical protein